MVAQMQKSYGKENKMKKIAFLLLCLFLALGCNFKENEQRRKKEDYLGRLEKIVFVTHGKGMLRHKDEILYFSSGKTTKNISEPSGGLKFDVEYEKDSYNYGFFWGTRLQEIKKQKEK